MTYANPVQAAIDVILDLDVPDELLADALAAQLEYIVGDEVESLSNSTSFFSSAI